MASSQQPRTTKKTLAEILQAAKDGQLASLFLESTKNVLESNPNWDIIVISRVLAHAVPQTVTDHGVLLLIDSVLNMVIKRYPDHKATFLTNHLGTKLLQYLVADDKSLQKLRVQVAVFKLEICKVLNQLISSVNVKHRLEFRNNNRKYVEKLPRVLESVGDIDAQIHMTECLYRLCSGPEEREHFSREWFQNRKVQSLFTKLSKSGFEVECRLFLNELNWHLGSRARVFTYSCKEMRIGSRVINKPIDKGYTDFWVDFNEGSKTVFIFCNNTAEEGVWDAFTADTSDISAVTLHLDDTSTKQVMKIQLLKAAYLLFDYSSMSQFPGVEVTMVFEASVPLAEVLRKVFGFNVSLKTGQKEDELQSSASQEFEFRRSKAVQKTMVDHEYPLTQGVSSPPEVDDSNLDFDEDNDLNTAQPLDFSEEDPVARSIKASNKLRNIDEMVEAKEVSAPAQKSLEKPVNKPVKTPVNKNHIEKSKEPVLLEPTRVQEPVLVDKSSVVAKKPVTKKPVAQNLVMKPAEKSVESSKPITPPKPINNQMNNNENITKSTGKKRKLFDADENYLAETQSEDDNRKQPKKGVHGPFNSTVIAGKKSRLSVQVPSFSEAHCMLDKVQKKPTTKKSATKKPIAKETADKKAVDVGQGDSPAPTTRSLRKRKQTCYKETSSVSSNAPTLAKADTKVKDKVRSTTLFSDLSSTDSDAKINTSQGFGVWRKETACKMYGIKPSKKKLTTFLPKKLQQNGKQKKEADKKQDKYFGFSSEFSDGDEVLRDDSHSFKASARLNDQDLKFSPDLKFSSTAQKGRGDVFEPEESPPKKKPANAKKPKKSLPPPPLVPPDFDSSIPSPTPPSRKKDSITKTDKAKVQEDMQYSPAPQEDPEDFVEAPNQSSSPKKPKSSLQLSKNGPIAKDTPKARVHISPMAGPRRNLWPKHPQPHEDAEDSGLGSGCQNCDKFADLFVSLLNLPICQNTIRKIVLNEED